jgi:hypothetical protein
MRLNPAHHQGRYVGHAMGACYYPKTPFLSKLGTKVTVRPGPLAEAQRSAQDVLKVAHKDALKDSHDAGDGVDGGCSPPGLVG